VLFVEHHERLKAFRNKFQRFWMRKSIVGDLSSNIASRVAREF
jgi:hypothetical protein